MKRPALLILLTLLFTQCISVKKLLQQGTVLKADIDRPFAFEYDRNLLFIDVQINGIPKRFIIDSGAPTVISLELKEELQLKKVKKTDVSDSQNSKAELEFVVLGDLSFGGVEIGQSAALATDLSLFHCLGIDGLLGANVMSHFDWEIDYQAQQIQLYRKDGPEQPEASYPVAIPFTITSQGTPELEVKIPGLLSAFGVTLDLGSTGNIKVNKPDELTIQRDASSTFSYGRTSKGIFGANIDTSYYLLVDSLFIGEVPFPSALVTTFNTSNKIGNQFWERYQLLISWSDSRLYLRPRKVAPPQLPELLLKIGYEKEAVEILTVYEKFALGNHKAGVGDQVIAINGTNTERITLEDYCTLREQAREEIRLRIKQRESGAIVEIKLREDEVKW